MKEIPLTKGYVALVDDEDYERVAQFNWHAHLARDTVYARRSFNRKPHIYLHRFIMGIEPGMRCDVDHQDRNGLNCQRSNLRVATHAQNIHNQKKRRDNTSGYIGVTWFRSRQKWLARVVHEGRVHVAGQFDNPEDAARAYDAMVWRLRGEFAHLNFPGELARAEWTK